MTLAVARATVERFLDAACVDRGEDDDRGSNGTTGGRSSVLADLYTDKFLRAGFDTDPVLLHLTERDLDTIGVAPPGHRKLILLHSKDILQSFVWNCIG